MDHRCIRFATCGALAALALGVTVPARAQGILGRVRDRARQAASGNAQPAAAPHCDNTTPPITADVVTRYVRGLEARDAELRRLAQQNSPVGRYLAAQLVNDSMERRRNDLAAGTGRDYARRQALQQRMMTGDASAVQAMSAQAQELEARVPMPTVDWASMNAANTRLDTIQLQAGGFGVCEWNGVMEVIPSIANQIASNPGLGASELIVLGYRPNGLSEAEATAIRAHRMDLIRLLKLNYKSDEMIAREQAERAHRDSMTTQMNTWSACRQRVMGPAASPMAGANQDSMRVWAAQAQDAQKRGDQATMMAIAQKMQMAMAPGMMQQGMGMQQVQQQCGPMPGTPR